VRHIQQDSDKTFSPERCTFRKPENSSLIKNYDSPQLTESAIQMAETFLVKCLKPSTELKTLDDLRFAAFNNNGFKVNCERATCTSTNVRKHILRGYQHQMWVQAPFRDASLIMNAESYGFVRRCSLLVISKPEGLPDPCTCDCCCKNPITEWTLPDIPGLSYYLSVISDTYWNILYNKCCVILHIPDTYRVLMCANGCNKFSRYCCLLK
jgi:hypothetical protein